MRFGKRSSGSDRFREVCEDRRVGLPRDAIGNTQWCVLDACLHMGPVPSLADYRTQHF